MLAEFCFRAVFVAVVEDWAVVTAEDDECILGEFQAIDCFNEFADAPVQLPPTGVTVADLIKLTISSNE